MNYIMLCNTTTLIMVMRTIIMRILDILYD